MLSTVHRLRAILTYLLLVPGIPLFAQEEGSEPLDVGLREQVEVQLVLIDVLVVDRKGRTVPDLSVEDFELFVGGKPVEIATLDAHCPLGAADDPRASSDREDRTAPQAVPQRTRRIVLAFDYFHMPSAAESLEYAKEAVRKLRVGGEEHMVVTIGEGLRIEAPFTSDRDEVLRALERMEHDVALYAGNYGRLTETRVFDRLKHLLDLLETMPGRKIVVLFSGPFMPDGFYHDPSFKRLAAMAAKSRTSLYPVDSAGMRTTRGLAPPMLARLAVETGGRLTANTNDLTLGYARAQRDLGCGYSLGFYDRKPRLDRSRRISVHVRQRGIRVIHPSFYVLRSGGKRRKSLIRTASMAPEVFESGGLMMEVFATRPHSPRRWEALVAVGIPPAPEGLSGDGIEWDLRGVIRTPSGALIHSFDRKVTPHEAEHSGWSDPGQIVVERAKLKPGRYKACIVLTHRESEIPLAAFRHFEIPKIPRNELFLIGPFLGRRGRGDGEPSDPGAFFEPLLLPQAKQGETLDSVVRVCLVGPDKPADGTVIRRIVTSAAGAVVGAFDPAPLALEEQGKVRCQALFDRLPTSTLEPGRYAMQAFSELRDNREDRGQIAFTLRPDISEAP